MGSRPRTISPLNKSANNRSCEDEKNVNFHGKIDLQEPIPYQLTSKFSTFNCDYNR